MMSPVELERKRGALKTIMNVGAPAALLLLAFVWQSQRS